jgi:hypothetical protein
MKIEARFEALHRCRYARRQANSLQPFETAKPRQPDA